MAMVIDIYLGGSLRSYISENIFSRSSWGQSELWRKLDKISNRVSLRKKIPLFPPEVHELRMRTLEDTLKILNALHDAMIYCKERA